MSDHAITVNSVSFSGRGGGVTAYCRICAHVLARLEGDQELTKVVAMLPERCPSCGRRKLGGKGFQERYVELREAVNKSIVRLSSFADGEPVSLLSQAVRTEIQRLREAIDRGDHGE